ncbi:MAG: macro domain-containing protein [Gemmatimonadota bacterium]
MTTAPLAELEVQALLRPVASDWSAVSPVVRVLEIAAGPAWTERCRAVGDLPLGSAVITEAGDLKAEFVIHVAVRSADEQVGPRTVELALRNGLRRAEEWGVRELALPLLGTGPGNLEPRVACAAMAGPLDDFAAAPAGDRRVLVCVASDFEREAALARWGEGRAGAGRGAADREGAD